MMCEWSLSVSLATSWADEETPAQGEAVAPPFESFSRKVPAQARDAFPFSWFWQGQFMTLQDCF
jgi:hypothetical protein